MISFLKKDTYTRDDLRKQIVDSMKDIHDNDFLKASDKKERIATLWLFAYSLGFHPDRLESESYDR